jgi:hypothetical protein
VQSRSPLRHLSARLARVDSPPRAGSLQSTAADAPFVVPRLIEDRWPATASSRSSYSSVSHEAPTRRAGVDARITGYTFVGKLETWRAVDFEAVHRTTISRKSGI